MAHKSDVDRYWGCHLPVMGRKMVAVTYLCLGSVLGAVTHL